MAQSSSCHANWIQDNKNGYDDSTLVNFHLNEGTLHKIPS
jgi:hypothetical protein